jgi:hypothetical protein
MNGHLLFLILHQTLEVHLTLAALPAAPSQFFSQLDIRLSKKAFRHTLEYELRMGLKRTEAMH